MKRNKHLLLWSSLGVLLLLGVAIVQENILRQWRQIQRSAQTDAGGVEVRLRQVMAPALKATDRCVSCHVGMAPGEQGVRGSRVVEAHKPVVHDPADIGCTVCHSGQGRATDKDDAHGNVEFCPEPMIPLQYAYAGCGRCHTHLQVPDQQLLREGWKLIERHDCLACHRLDERGGTVRPGAPADLQGPDLSRAGAAGYDAQWYDKHLAHSEAAKEGPWKTSFSAIDERGRQAIGVVLSSRVGAPELVEAKALFHSLGCRGCHKVGGVGGDDGPDLSLVGQKDPARLDFAHVPEPHTVANWLAEHFRSPAQVVPGSQMPRLGLSEKQVHQLTLYMLSLRRTDAPEAHWPKDRIRAERFGDREFATDGGTLYGTFCAACHGERGQGMRYPGMPIFPAIANPDFLAVASDQFLIDSVSHGRTGRRMPAWGEKEGGLRPEEIARVVAYLRQTSGVSAPQASGRPRRWVSAASAADGQRLYQTNCAGCHGAQGQGIDAPALNNASLLKAADDDYLSQTIARGRGGTAMPNFAKGSPVYPALTNAQIESIVAFLRTWEKP